MLNAIKMQISVLSQRTSTIIMCFLMLALMLINYYANIFTYYGTNAVQMYHPMKLLLLSDYSAWGYYFAQYFPLLVVIPAAFSYFSDKSSREILFLQSRIGKRTYYISKYIATFLVTFFVFTVPLLLEVILNCIAFPLSATGDPSNSSEYTITYVEGVNMYFFRDLYVQNPIAYAVLLIVIFGILSGILAMFALSFSTLSFVRFRVLIFVPVYALLMVLAVLPVHVESNYFFYIRLYSPVPDGEWPYIFGMLAILLVTVFIAYQNIRRDEIL